jgi:hypothetical protein
MKTNQDLENAKSALKILGIEMNGGELLTVLFKLGQVYPIGHTMVRDGVGTVEVYLADRIVVGKANTHTFTVILSPELTALNLQMFAHKNTGNSFRVDLVEGVYEVRVAGEQVIFPPVKETHISSDFFEGVFDEDREPCNIALCTIKENDTNDQIQIGSEYLFSGIRESVDGSMELVFIDKNEKDFMFVVALPKNVADLNARIIEKYSDPSTVTLTYAKFVFNDTPLPKDMNPDDSAMCNIGGKYRLEVDGRPLYFRDWEQGMG